MGSNVLVADEGFPGYVLRLEGQFLEVAIEGERLTAGGGAALGGVCAAAARAGLSGIEAISGIPSSMGGAVRINAGAYGGEIFDVLESVRLVSRSGERRVAAAGEIPHGYRWSGLIETREIVSAATLRLASAPREDIQARTRAVSEKRRGALPSEPNAGSVFKNPEGDHAGRLIEACGLKGERAGGALISPRHANVIVNTGNASAADVLALMRKMRDAVREKFGITLMPEVELLGLKWTDLRILLLAGGGGTRLWPLSTEEKPKQFLALLSEKSLLAETYERLRPLSPEVFVATSARHTALVRRELPDVPAERVYSEPARRNSGPAVLAAAVRFAADGDPVTVAVPSDQTVRDGEAFRNALRAAAELADRSSVVILGVQPDAARDRLRLRRRVDGDAVRRFIEKPGPEKALEYSTSGLHLWNAGIFVFRPSRLLAEARRVAGDLVAGVERFVRTGAEADYEALPDISIDFAVMEKISGVRAVPLRAGWSDVGTWRSVRDLKGPSDAAGNLVISPVPVLAPGLRDAAIVVGERGVLVLPFEREGELKPSVEALRRREGPGTRKD